MSIVRVGLTETKGYADGYDAIFNKGKAKKAAAAAPPAKAAAKKTAPVKAAAKKSASAKPAAKKPASGKKK